MAERSWNLTVRDARGRRHRGKVDWLDKTPSLQPPPEGVAFRIVILARPATIADAPERTAICIPHRPVDLAPPPSLGRLSLDAADLTRFASGRIVMTPAGAVAGRDVFRRDEGHPRLETLALALVEAAAAEAIAPYVAVIHHALGLPRGADALAALQGRLAPDDPRERPPARAPGIVRLNRVLRDLRAGTPPRSSLDVLAGDLRLLRLFAMEEPTLPREALARLLDDVNAAAPRPARRPGKVVPLRARRRAP